MEISDTELQILRSVVARFTNSNEPTKRKDVVVKFRSPQAIDRLIKLELLKALDSDGNLAPWACGIACSGDSDAQMRATQSVGVVLLALQSLYYAVPERKQISRLELSTEITKIRGEVAQQVVRRGLYFVTEFRVLDAYGPAPGPVRDPLFNVEWFTISEQIVTVDVDTAWELHILKCTSKAEVSQPLPTATAGNSKEDQLEIDRSFARIAIEEARKSISEGDGRPRPKVGAVVVKNGQLITKAHRGEFLGNHAEFVALERKLPDAILAGATVYTTLEPCTTRNHPKVPCAQRLAQRKVARVVIGMLDPDARITGKGLRALRRANIVTDLFPSDLMAEVEEMNRDFTEFCERDLGLESNSKTPEAVRQNSLSIGDSSTTDHLLEGRRWVEHALNALLQQRGLILDSPIRWIPDLDHQIYTLQAAIGGISKIWRLSYEALEDCVEDQNVRRTLKRSLNLYFAPDSEIHSNLIKYDSMDEQEIVDALKKHQKGECLSQEAIHNLDEHGYVKTADVTNMQSEGRELLLISITPKGLALLAGFQS